MPQTYIAITIGPITKTFAQVRKTRELWAASYLFSLLSQSIIEKLSDKAIVMPYTGSVDIADKPFNMMQNKSGVGLFPDRIIYKATANDFTVLQDTLIPNAIDALSAVWKLDPTLLRRYCCIHTLCMELPDDSNAIIALSPYLDALELREKIEATEADETTLFRFFNTINQHPFFKSLFSGPGGKALPGCMIRDTNDQARFESLVEITTRDVRGNTEAEQKIYKDLMNIHIWDNHKDIDGDEAFLTALKNYCAEEAKVQNTKSRFKAYHKYICIVKADGDKIGRTLESLQPNELSSFSQSLLRWGIRARDAISAYKGVPIYIGGDDLLFFAPVRNGNQCIATLIAEIDAIFNEEFGNFTQKPTLSYGISISFYKYPLFEAIQAADDCLHKAKAIPGKNAVAIRILKHSGSVLQWQCSKDSDLYKTHFSTLLTNLEADGGFINSAAFRIRDNEALFEIIGSDAGRVQAFFNNNFDEDVHGQKRAYLNKVAALLPAVVQHYQQALLEANKKAITQKAMADVYSILKTVNFLNGVDDEH